MTTTNRFTSADLEPLPYDNHRYEVIDGTCIRVSHAPTFIETCAPDLVEDWNQGGDEFPPYRGHRDA